MAQEDKTKEELIEEITFLQKRIAETDKLYNECKKSKEIVLFGEDQVQAIIDNIPALVYIKDLEGRIILVNHKFEAVFNQPHEYLIGKTSHDLLPQEIAEAHRKNDLQVLSEKKPILVEEVNEEPDGRHTYLSVKFPLFDTAGRLDRVCGISTDITGRKKLEDQLRKSQERYRDLVEGIDDLITIVDQQGKLIYVNHVAEKIFGLSPEDCVGLSAFDFIHPDDQERTKNEFENWVRNKVAHASHQNRQVSKSGKVFEMLWAINPHFDSAGRIIDIFNIARDITEQKKIEVYKDIGREVLSVLNGSESLEHSVNRVLAILKTHTGCDAVGIRLQEGDDFPYFIQQGFSDNFLLTENTLIERSRDGGVCRDKNGKVNLECTCGLVIGGKTDPASSFFTPGGSFWTNDSFPLLELPAQQDPRLNPRNQCIHQGYASVALIPIRNENKIVGLLQLNDRRKDLFSLIKIELLEEIATHLGEALIRKKLEEANNNHLRELEVFYKASVGREERILELKKEVEDLKNKLAK